MPQKNDENFDNVVKVQNRLLNIIKKCFTLKYSNITTSARDTLKIKSELYIDSDQVCIVQRRKEVICERGANQKLRITQIAVIHMKQKDTVPITATCTLNYKPDIALLNTKVNTYSTHMRNFSRSCYGGSEVENRFV